MNGYFATFFLFLVFGFISTGQIAKKWDTSTVKTTHILWRGGVHTFEEENKCPGLPYKFKENFGELTLAGKWTCYHVGQFFRKHYMHLFDDKYDPYTIRLWTGWKNHSIEAAQLAAAAMFPPKPKPDPSHWNPDLPWQPIPTQEEKLLAQGGVFHLIYEGPKCMSQMYTLQSDEIQQFALNNYNLIEFLCNNGQCTTNGQCVNNNCSPDLKSFRALQAFQIASCILLEVTTPEYFPAWVHTRPTLIQESIAYTSQFINILCGFDSLRRLSGGWLLGQIISEMNLHVGGNWIRKFSTFSMHVDVMSAMVNILGDIPVNWPGFGTAFALELHLINNTHQVQAWFWRGIENNTEPENFQIHNCPDPCTLEKFSSYSSWDPGENWLEECNGTGTDTGTSPGTEPTVQGPIQSLTAQANTANGILIALTVVFFLLFLIAIILWLNEKRKSKEAAERATLIH